MNVATVLAEIAACGVELWFEGDRLRFRAPKGALVPQHRDWLSANRETVLAALVADAKSRNTSHPVSFGQKAMWFIQQQTPKSSAYNVSIPTRVRSRVKVPALRNAVQALVDRHSSLRTVFAVDNGELLQIVSGWAAAPFEERLIGSTADAALRQQVEDEAAKPFDLAEGPMLRVVLVTLAPDDHVLLLTAHHIATDGWSVLMLFDELTKLYREFVGGEPSGLSRPKADYVAYTIWQRDMLDGPQGERLWTYWRDRLVPPREPLNLPLDRRAPPIPTFNGGSADIPLAPELTRHMRQLGMSLGVTPFVLWLAALKAFLADLTGARDIIVGTPTFGRSRPEFMSVIGNFVNSVPLRSRINADTTLKSLAVSVRTTVAEALDAQEFPFSRLVQLIHPDRTGGETPLFRVFFVLQRFDQFRHVHTLTPSTIGGLALAPFPIRERSAQFDLSLQMIELDDGISASFSYNSDVFDAATAERLAKDFAAFVGKLAADPNRALEVAPPGSASVPEPDAALQALLARLDDADVKITMVDGKLKINAPKGVLDEGLRAQLVANRDKLLVYLATPRSTAGSLVRIPRTGTLPLSAAQRRLWFNARMQPDSNQYNVGGALILSGPLDVATFRKSIGALVRRHETLRMTIGERDGAPDPRIRSADDECALLPVVSVASREAAKTLAEKLLREPFDLAKGPLARFHLLRLAAEEHVLVSCLHHIVADGWSLSILMADFSEIYEALLEARAPILRPLTIGAVDYAAWENRQTEAARWNKQVDFWRTALAGAPAVLDLPTDRPRLAQRSADGRRFVQYLDRDLAQQLRACAQRHGATLFMVMLGAWNVLMYRMSGQEDVLTGIPHSDRHSHGLDAAVGCLINTVPIRVRFEGAPTFVDILIQTRNTTVAALEHASVPFDVLVAALNPDRGIGHSPIFQVLFTSLDFPRPASLPSGLTLDPMELDLASTRLDLTVEFAEVQFGAHAGQTAVMYEYATDLFDAETVERLHHHYWKLLAAVAADPQQPVQALSLIDAADERRLVDTLGSTDHDHDRRLCAHQLIESAAAAGPDRVAVVADRKRLSYAELDAGANRLARLLAVRGVSRGTRVALCLDRTAEMPMAALAVLKAGAAYVPLDPSHPADRLRYIIGDAGAVCVITLERYSRLFGETPMVLLDRDSSLIASQVPAHVDSGVTPSDLAYLIYTSGSTGRPKGVEVEHRNLVAFLVAMRLEPGIERNDVVLAVTTLSFDIAGLELWLPLSNGAQVVVASRNDGLDGSRLSDLMEEHGVTLFQATPATWRLLLDSGWTGKRDLKALCGGEAMPRILAQALVPRVASLWNMYGPTETTIWSTASRIADADQPISIGRPIANTRIYVLTAADKIAPIGVVGELVIAGEGVARGYHNRSDLTSKAFGTISIAGRRERIYRTGDLARLRADGTLDYLGRRDHQVKVRGYRIELGEIEAALASVPGVGNAVVAVKSYGQGDERLVGYVTLAPGFSVDPEAVRLKLRERLPEYMVPAHIVDVPTFPLTPNGKLDRGALPMPNGKRQNLRAGPAVAMTDTQRRLVAIWTSVLQTDKVGLADNFFDLGGHSMLLVRLQAAIRAEFDQVVTLVELFQHTTVSAQAERLGSATRSASDLVARAAARARRQSHA